MNFSSSNIDLHIGLHETGAETKRVLDALSRTANSMHASGGGILVAAGIRFCLPRKQYIMKTSSARLQNIQQPHLLSSLVVNITLITTSVGGGGVVRKAVARVCLCQRSKCYNFLIFSQNLNSQHSLRHTKPPLNTWNCSQIGG